jgi:ribonuclease VapC
MLLLETDADDLLERLDSDGDRIWSAIAQWEAIAAFRRAREIEPELARASVTELATRLDFRLVTIGAAEAASAFDAFARYGKGRHPAALNMGDCFAYACARTNDARLLYKGDDFSHTDLA